jgi:hypothetical protein
MAILLYCFCFEIFKEDGDTEAFDLKAGHTL